MTKIVDVRHNSIDNATDRIPVGSTWCVAGIFNEMRSSFVFLGEGHYNERFLSDELSRLLDREIVINTVLMVPDDDDVEEKDEYNMSLQGNDNTQHLTTLRGICDQYCALFRCYISAEADDSEVIIPPTYEYDETYAGDWYGTFINYRGVGDCMPRAPLHNGYVKRLNKYVIY